VNIWQRLPFDFLKTTKNRFRNRNTNCRIRTATQQNTTRERGGSKEIFELKAHFLSKKTLPQLSIIKKIYFCTPKKMGVILLYN
jgi:hypothetical protein